MTKRTHRAAFSFARPSALAGVDQMLAPGTYDVVTEEELIDGLSFPVYRRLSTVMFVPGLSASSIEMITIDPLDLAAARVRDALPQDKKDPLCR